MTIRSSIAARIGVLMLSALAALPCLGAENAVLRNGFSIRHERREVIGDVTRLYVNAEGSSFVDVSTAQIDHFEAAPELASPAAPVSNSSLPASNSAMPAAQPVATRASSFVPTARNTSPADLNDIVTTASGRYRLDPDLVNSVIRAESGFNARAVSPKGAQGLMQLMPGTASTLGVPNAFDPQANVEGGTKYLRELLERYNFDLVKALAAYNAGPQRVEQYKGVPPYYETQAYVARVVRDFNKKKSAQEAAKSTTLAKSTKRGTAKTNHAGEGARATQHPIGKTHASPLEQAKTTPSPQSSE